MKIPRKYHIHFVEIESTYCFFFKMACNSLLYFDNLTKVE